MQIDNEQKSPSLTDVNEVFAHPLSSSITIYVNDKPIQTDSGQTLTDFFRQLQLDKGKNLAVALNNSIVSKGEWPDCVLQAEDQLLLIAPISGG